MVNKVAAALLEGFFPNYCCLCQLRSNSDFPLCRKCRSELGANTLPCCRCALPLPPAESVSSPRLCGHCLQTPPSFNQVVAPWLYTEQMAYLIGRWKFHGEQRLTPLLADLWLQQVGHIADIDLLVPVPLHWRRLWSRGFNQSELLCRELRRRNSRVAAASLQPRLCRRNRATAAQSGMNAPARAINLRAAFTVQNRCDNLRVAVVDDVLTTGATAAAMATALRDAGAARVDIWCLARTPAPDA